MPAIVQVIDSQVVVTPYGFAFLEPYLEQVAEDAADAETAAGEAATSAAAAAASATAAALSETAAGNSADAAQDSANIAVAAEAGVLEAIAGEDITSPIYLNAANIAALQAITERTGGTVVLLTETGRAGAFEWNVGNFTAEVTADPLKGIYVAAGDDLTGASGVWQRVLVDNIARPEWWGTTGAGVTDDRPAILAALNSPLPTIELGQGTFAINAQLIIPTGKWFRGQGAGKTIITPLSTYTPRTAGFNQGITCANTASNVKCTDMTWDGNKVGLGLGSSMRISAFVPSGANFYFARLSVLDCTGYAVWTFGKDDATPCSGVVEDIWSWNADVHFESSKADGVKWIRCHARIGDGDHSNSTAFHPYDGSTNIDYIDCSAKGTISSPMTSIADTFDVAIRMINCTIETDAAAAPALQPTGAFETDLYIEGGRYVSEDGPAVSVAAGVTLRAIGTEFEGYQVGVGVAGKADLTSVRVTASTPEGSGLNTSALYNDGETIVGGVSYLTAISTIAAPFVGAVEPILGPAVILEPAPAGAIRIRQQTAGQAAPTADGTSGGDNLFYLDILSPYAPVDPDKCHISLSLHDTAETDSALGAAGFSSKWAHMSGVAANAFRVRIRTPASLAGVHVAYHFVEWADA